ncbi:MULTISPECIES: DUF4878 domain-containing protein [Capnocytophaga]|uniref:Uncharacterized protein n=1 Tax=Capnocytophaga canis TaxID=1848903 RepID=A0A0B7IU77_9FLAO|nr:MULTISPECIES: DUF4878 domain-containing protein [Capnocytophaga]ATA75702.1 DUF4878 domain-containing protein [Capnocytophaga sp. H2931]CEN54159.1 conserved exported hypothetical protein [Capnocytophaga canis]
MRKVFFIATLFVAFLVTSCSNNSPKSVAEKFLTSMENSDFEEAKKYADDSMQQMLGMLSGMGKELPKGNEKKKVTITKVEEDGDNAKAFYKVEGEEEEKSIDLKKVDGKWKVTFNKENSNKENMPNMDDVDLGESSLEEVNEEVQEAVGQ